MRNEIPSNWTAEVETVEQARQWYRATAHEFAGRPALAPSIELARRVLGEALWIENQCARVGAGVSFAIPVRQVATWAARGAVLVYLADQVLLEVTRPESAPELVPPRTPVVLDPAHAVRFLTASTEQESELVLIRAAAPSMLPPRRRFSARVFARTPSSSGEQLSVDWTKQRLLHFLSHPRIVAQLEPATMEDVASEPIFDACAIPMASTIGGPLLHRFLEALPPDWRVPSADVRVGVTRDELSPGWNPCAVNFHIDGTSRVRKRADGHPDLVDPGPTVDQMIACFGPASPTRFLVGEVVLPEPPAGDVARAAGPRWATILDEHLRSGRLTEWNAPSDALVEFGFGVFHTGAVSRRPGWRCFVKAMRNRGDPMPTAPTYRDRNSVSWPIDGPEYPSDPCGVFPEDVP
ncbi:MAG: hypothetical protein GC161_04340 [Planctomycetaceae bacterium]|nr:hypothetical protein [Planctomycetaceae bacterium]